MNKSDAFLTVKALAGCLGLAMLIAWIVLHLFACTPEMKEVAAASGYEAQQMACVDRYNDKASIDKCRDKVKAAWATDAGKDGAHD